MDQPEQTALVNRITEYLSLGGLWNPESVEHNKVRDLLIDCRGFLAAPAVDQPEQACAQKIYEQIASACSEVGIDTPDGTCLGAVRKLADAYTEMCTDAENLQAQLSELAAPAVSPDVPQAGLSYPELKKAFNRVCATLRKQSVTLRETIDSLMHDPDCPAECTRCTLTEVMDKSSESTTPVAASPSAGAHLKHVQRFLLEMYQTMVDPVEEFQGNIEQLCELLLKRAREDRERAAVSPDVPQVVHVLVAQMSDLAVEMEKHSNDHIHDKEPENLQAAVEGVCADRINAILKPYRAPAAASPSAGAQLLRGDLLVDIYNDETLVGEKACYSSPDDAPMSANINAWYSHAVYWRKRAERLERVAASPDVPRCPKCKSAVIGPWNDDYRICLSCRERIFIGVAPVAASPDVLAAAEIAGFDAGWAEAIRETMTLEERKRIQANGRGELQKLLQKERADVLARIDELREEWRDTEWLDKFMRPERSAILMCEQKLKMLRNELAKGKQP